MEKKTYEAVVFEIIKFTTEDIIITSECCDTLNEGNG